MSKKIGLVITGSLQRFGLAKNPGFTARLGPVLSSRLRVASRFAGILRCGYGTDCWDALTECSLVFVCAPGDQLERLTGAMSNAIADWSGRTVILWDDLRSSRSLALLAARGARVGSLCPWPSPRQNQLLFEGDREAFVELRRLLRSWGRRIVTVPTPGKPAVHSVWAALSCLSAALLEAGDRSLRSLHVRNADIPQAVEALVTDAARAHGKPGRKNWRSAYSMEDLLQLEADLADMTLLEPAVLAFLVRLLEEARIRLRQPGRQVRMASHAAGQS